MISSLFAKVMNHVEDKGIAVDSIDMVTLGKEASDLDLDTVNTTIENLDSILDDPDWIRQVHAEVGALKWIDRVWAL